MQHALKTVEFPHPTHPLTGKVYPDDDTESPRDWDTLGTFYFHCPRYLSSDKGCEFDGEEPSEVLSRLRGEDPDGDGEGTEYYFAPIGAHIHSGIVLWMGTPESAQTRGSCPWDSGTVGYAYVSKQRARESFPDCASEAELERRVYDCLESEVKTFGQYVEGDVYVYSIETPDGDTVESCGGFYGTADVLESMRETALAYQAHESAAALDYACRC